MRFVELVYVLATEEAERIGVDHVARVSGGNPRESSIGQLTWTDSSYPLQLQFWIYFYFITLPAERHMTFPPYAIGTVGCSLWSVAKRAGHRTEEWLDLDWPNFTGSSKLLLYRHITYDIEFCFHSAANLIRILTISAKIMPLAFYGPHWPSLRILTWAHSWVASMLVIRQLVRIWTKIAFFPVVGWSILGFAWPTNWWASCSNLVYTGQINLLSLSNVNFQHIFIRNFPQKSVHFRKIYLNVMNVERVRVFAQITNSVVFFAVRWSDGF